MAIEAKAVYILFWMQSLRGFSHHLPGSPASQGRRIQIANTPWQWECVEIPRGELEQLARSARKLGWEANHPRQRLHPKQIVNRP